MIIFLYGPDSYRREHKKKEILAEYCKKHLALTIEQYDLEEKDGLDSLKDYIKNRSLFDPLKCAVVRNIEVIKESGADIAWLEGFTTMADVVLVIVGDTKPVKALSFLLKKPVVSQEFDYLTGTEFKIFVEREAQARGAQLSAAQLASLGVHYRNDMWGLVTELDVVALSNNKLPTTNYQATRDFFTMVKTVAYGRGEEKITALEELLNNDDPAKTFNILASLVSGEKKIQMADYDVAIKAGRLDYEVALLDFALQ